MVFVCLFVTLWVYGCTVRSMGTYFEQVLCHGLWVDTDALPVQKDKLLPIFVARWRNNFFHHIAIENCENSKNRRKRLCAPLHVDSRKILIKFHRRTLGPITYSYSFIDEKCQNTLSHNM